MEYGSVLPAGFVVPKSSFHIAKDIATINPFRDVVVPSGCVVMDCGGHIGSFSAAALESGAGRTFCFEPEPRNFRQLSDNLLRYGSRALAIAAALVATDDPTVVLMLSGFTGAHSIVKRGSRNKALRVQAMNFRKMLTAIRPQVLKMDVESAEYDLFDTLQVGDLQSVVSLFLEFHPIDHRDERMHRVQTFVHDEGLTAVNTRPRRYTANRVTT